MSTRIPTTLRTLLVLEALAKAGRPQTPTAINESLGLPKPTIHRICDKLVHEGFLNRRLGTRNIWPSRRLRQFAIEILSGTHAHIFRHKALEYVVETIGESCNLVLPGDNGMLYIDRVENAWPINFHLPIGSRVPMHCTASGKLFLSSLGKAELKRFIPMLELTRKATNTITDKDALLSELDSIRAQGFSEDNEEFITGMTAIAVPVLDHKDMFFAAISTHGTVQRFPYERLRDHLPILYEGARRVRNTILEDN